MTLDRLRIVSRRAATVVIAAGACLLFGPIPVVSAATGGAPLGRVVAVASLASTKASQLATDGDGFCAVVSGGGARCWGLNTDGALGDGSTAANSHTPVAVKGLAATSIVGDAANNGYCAVLSGGDVDCWGYNGSGQLGDGSTAMDSDVPVAVSGVSDVVALVSDGFSFCALTARGGAKCWGYDDYGQLGDGGLETDSNVPVAVKGLSGATRLVTDDNDGYCGVVTGGALECWGYNVAGALGKGSTAAVLTSSNVPVDVTGLSKVRAVSGDVTGYCAVLSGGSAKCWGYNDSGQLGAGSAVISSPAPVPVKGLNGATAILGVHSGSGGYCALVSGGGVRCWGPNGSGSLGDGATGAASNTPVTASGLSGVVQLATSNSSFCARDTTGSVKCWGYNLDGQLGNGTTAFAVATPAAVTGLSGATTVIGDGTGYSASLTTGAVKCWGYNLYGQLGDASTTLSSATPVAVTGFGS